MKKKNLLLDWVVKTNQFAKNLFVIPMFVPMIELFQYEWKSFRKLLVIHTDRNEEQQKRTIGKQIRIAESYCEDNFTNVARKRLLVPWNSVRIRNINIPITLIFLFHFSVFLEYFHFFSSNFRFSLLNKNVISTFNTLLHSQYLERMIHKIRIKMSIFNPTKQSGCGGHHQCIDGKSDQNIFQVFVRYVLALIVCLHQKFQRIIFRIWIQRNISLYPPFDEKNSHERNIYQRHRCPSNVQKYHWLCRARTERLQSCKLPTTKRRFEEAHAMIVRNHATQTWKRMSNLLPNRINWLQVWWWCTKYIESAQICWSPHLPDTHTAKLGLVDSFRVDLSSFLICKILFRSEKVFKNSKFECVNEICWRLNSLKNIIWNVFSSYFFILTYKREYRRRLVGLSNWSNSNLNWNESDSHFILLYRQVCIGPRNSWLN